VPRHRETSRPKNPRTAEPGPGFVAIGIIRAARGIHGELRIEPLSDIEGRFDPGRRVYIDGTAYLLARARSDRHGLLLTIDGVSGRDAAESLIGKVLEIREDESPSLPEDTYYRHEIVGLRVFDAAGASIGRIEEVLETGANDVYVVRDESGETLIPAVDSIVKRVDLALREMHVELIPGLERREVKSRSS
jgi:16S rRNA processing protein RimM